MLVNTACYTVKRHTSSEIMSVEILILIYHLCIDILSVVNVSASVQPDTNLLPFETHMKSAADLNHFCAWGQSKLRHYLITQSFVAA